MSHWKYILTLLHIANIQKKVNIEGLLKYGTKAIIKGQQEHTKHFLRAQGKALDSLW